MILDEGQGAPQGLRIIFSFASSFFALDFALIVAIASILFDI